MTVNGWSDSGSIGGLAVAVGRDRLRGGVAGPTFSGALPPGDDLGECGALCHPGPLGIAPERIATDRRLGSGEACPNTDPNPVPHLPQIA